MIGVSEYSTAYLTNEGKRLIENAICYLLGIENTHPQGIDDAEANSSRGGSFINSPDDSRVSARSYSPGYISSGLGFRLAM